MKSKFTLLLFCLQTFFVFSQSVGIGTANIDPSAKLQVEDTQRGFLPPRLTTTQRNAIVNPAEGLMIFNITTHCIEYYDGSLWESTCNSGTNTILYDNIFTAKWLDTSSIVVNAVGQTHTYNSTGDYVIYNSASLMDGNILSIDLIPAGVLSNSKSYIVEITVSQSEIVNTPLNLNPDGFPDSDLTFGIANITDNDFVGFATNDNANAQLAALDGFKGSSLIYGSYKAKGVNSFSHNARLVTTNIFLQDTSKTWGAFTNVEHENWSIPALTYANIIEPNKGLQLQLYRGHPYEGYVIDYIRVQVRKQIE